MLILVKCSRCRRLVRYMASDLAELFGPLRAALDPPYRCSRCSSWDYIHVDTYTPNLGDYGHLVVRRPNGVRTTQLWRNEPLGQAKPADSTAWPVDDEKYPMG